MVHVERLDVKNGGAKDKESGSESDGEKGRGGNEGAVEFRQERSKRKHAGFEERFRRYTGVCEE